jgi:hypothetical protein
MTCNCRAEFFRLAAAGVAAGLLTWKLARAIWDRPRKRVYWCSNLAHLRVFIEERRAQRQETFGERSV